MKPTWNLNEKQLDGKLETDVMEFQSITFLQCGDVDLLLFG